jgi:hypothetical protein
MDMKTRIIMSFGVILIACSSLFLVSGCSGGSDERSSTPMEAYRLQAREAAEAMWSIPNNLEPDSEAYYDELFRTQIARSRILSLIELALSPYHAWRVNYQIPYLLPRMDDNGRPVVENVYAPRYGFLIDEAIANSGTHTACEPKLSEMRVKLDILREEIEAVSPPVIDLSDSLTAYRAWVRRSWMLVEDTAGIERAQSPYGNGLVNINRVSPELAVLVSEELDEVTLPVEMLVVEDEMVPIGSLLGGLGDIARDNQQHSERAAPFREFLLCTTFLQSELTDNLKVCADASAPQEQWDAAKAKLVIIGEEALPYCGGE